MVAEAAMAAAEHVAATKCSSCPGVAHPATGCAWSARTLMCRACATRFWTWMRAHTATRKRKKNGKEIPSFYDAALKKDGDP